MNGAANPEPLNPQDLIVDAWPPDPGGMRVHAPRGVRIEHRPTGAVVTCTHERSQHLNRDAALRGVAAAVGCLLPVLGRTTDQ